MLFIFLSNLSIDQAFNEKSYTRTVASMAETTVEVEVEVDEVE